MIEDTWIIHIFLNNQHSCLSNHSSFHVVGYVTSCMFFDVISMTHEAMDKGHVKPTLSVQSWRKTQYLCCLSPHSILLKYGVRTEA